MDSDLFKAFAAEFTLEWNRLQAEASGELEARKTELARVRGQLERLVDALVEGTPVIPSRTVCKRSSSGGLPWERNWRRR